ncbi:GHMP family kinase ATP-binding protein [Streptomyces erythrochromogenes]|uniref:GHMP family kinase ATP-binding protein n=1 Tax=Streptomyces erythrochromogenes TaxID=285574 RepID=UPI00340AE2E6
MFTSEATVELDDRASELTVIPYWKAKALRAALLTASDLGIPSLRGVLRVESSIEVSLGFGSSTSDVTASIRAVLDAFGGNPHHARVARLAVQAESAADPLMFDEMVLFAHREGRLIESFHAALPPVAVLGFQLGLGPVDTLALPRARYNPDEIGRFDELRGLLRRAARTGDLAAIGRVATESARINQRFLPVPRFDDILGVARSTGTVGLQVAHSGSIGGFLFDPADPDHAQSVARAEKELSAIGIDGCWYYAAEPESIRPRTGGTD